jgi:CheY-like chemotaxis protein
VPIIQLQQLHHDTINLNNHKPNNIRIVMPKIMVVEDDNNLREIYEARLQAEGYTVVSAKDGEEGLSVAKTEKPDLVISDVMMPKISGFEMLDILRNTDGLKNIRIIMLTALGQIDDQQRAGKLGADRYLVKSQVTLEDIVKSAHELLQDTPETAEEPTPAAAAPAPMPTVDPTMAVASEPVTAAPMPSPVAPVAQPVLEPPVITQPAPVVLESPLAETPQAVVNQAQSSSDESANVNAGIEEFVAGAPDPASEGIKQVEESPATAPIAPPAPPPAPVPTTQQPTAMQADDAIMQTAVDSLTDQPLTAPPVVPQPVTAMPQAPTPVQAAPPDSNASQQVTVTHQKTLTPIGNASNKPDINTLYQLEQAKEQAAAPMSTDAVVSTPANPAPTVTTLPTGPTPAPGQPTQPTIDPNSIAL